MNEYSRSRYKRDPATSCFVPKCKSIVITSPEKHFFRVPDRNKAEWCVAAGKQNVPKGALYVCEDHLNVEEDLLNYNEWRSKNVFGKLKTDVPNLRNISASLTSSTAHIRPHRGALTALDQIPSTSFSSHLTEKESKSIMCEPEMQHKCVQYKPKTADRCVKTAKHLIKTKKKHIQKPIFLDMVKVSDTTDLSEDQTPSIFGSTTEYSETESSVNVFSSNKLLAGRQFMLNLIMKKPMCYLGLPKQLYWLIEYLATKCHICSLHIIITLYKMRNNDTFEKISDIFEISSVTLWRIYYKTLPVLRRFFQQFIFWPKQVDIKRNLPLVFRTNAVYANVQTIIDCFEIEIEKPKKPIEQSLTWSQYKSCNTIKYLIGATPDGFINFISEGYGGRISDINLVEQSGFLETVPENSTVLADRGFKHLESHLGSKNVKILRPPSVSKDCKMSKAEAVESKVIASLRVHIERLIRRVRLFRLLKPHSVVNNKLVKTLDDIVFVACGLINVQSPNVRNC